MISRLLTQFGLDVGSVMRPDPMLIGDRPSKTYNTFYVLEAVGSPYIPAQDDFVIPNGIKSVLGFGGVLSSGELFVVTMFSKASINKLEPLVHSTIDGLIARLRDLQESKTVVPILLAWTCVTMDIISDYAFRKSYNYVQT